MRAFVALLLCLACVKVVEVPRVVTAVVPYTAMLPLDPRENPGLDGRVICDLAGFPVILVRLGLDRPSTEAVLHHERAHVVQAQNHPGGCVGLRQQMSRDTMYRLVMEADAFCAVSDAQRKVGREPDPSWSEIFDILRTRYDAQYDSAAVVKAMRCQTTP